MNDNLPSISYLLKVSMWLSLSVGTGRLLHGVFWILARPLVGNTVMTFPQFLRERCAWTREFHLLSKDWGLTSCRHNSLEGKTHYPGTGGERGGSLLWKVNGATKHTDLHKSWICKLWTSHNNSPCSEVTKVFNFQRYNVLFKRFITRLHYFCTYENADLKN